MRYKQGLRLALYILTLYISTTVTGYIDTLAQDKSTSITCTGLGPCEKTECVNGDCETTTTNSSNISTTQGSDDKNSDMRESIIAERLRLRED